MHNFSVEKYGVKLPEVVLLEKKLLENCEGHKIIVVSVRKAFSSYRCSKCFYIDKGNRIANFSLFRCKMCGFESDPDLNASVNLYYRGMKQLSYLNLKAHKFYSKNKRNKKVIDLFDYICSL